MTLPQAPLSAGLLVLRPGTGTLLHVIQLQLTPDGVSRTITPRGGADDAGDATETRRLTGPPVETISLEAELDAIELSGDLGAPGLDVAAEVGLHAVLAELESLVTPTSRSLLDAHDLAASGAFEVLGEPQPDVLLVWGRQRVVPVRVTAMSVTEEGYDLDLNPLRATVSLTLRVLSVNDVGFASSAAARSLAHMGVRESLAERVRTTTTWGVGVNP